VSNNIFAIKSYRNNLQTKFTRRVIFQPYWQVKCFCADVSWYDSIITSIIVSILGTNNLIVIDYLVSNKSVVNNKTSWSVRTIIKQIYTHYIHTMYVIRSSNISIKTNFKQITRAKLKFVQYSKEDYISCMTSRYICRSFNDATLLCFLSHSNDMTSWQNISAENVSCNVASFFYHHGMVIQHLVSETLFLTGYFR
jgi:hypothetical protein